MNEEGVFPILQGQVEQGLYSVAPLGVSEDQEGERQILLLDGLHIGIPVTDPVVWRNPLKVSVEADGNDDKNTQGKGKKKIQ